jgi:hypothetical protein
MSQTGGQRVAALNREGEVSFRRWTAFLVVGVLAAACPISVAAAATSSQRTRSYPLPSDGWKPGQAAMQAISSAPFQATLTQSRTCTSSAHVDYLWPAGYRVRFHPTVLLNPRGRVVAHQGQYVTVGGGIVGTGSWPSAARCYKGGDVWAVQGPVQVGRPGQLAPSASLTTAPPTEPTTLPPQAGYRGV